MNTLHFQFEKYKVLSLRNLIQKLGLHKRSQITLRSSLNGPETKIFSSIPSNAGDVAVDKNSVHIQSDGFSCYYGTVFDHGTVSGDDFSITLYLNLPDTPVWSFTGHVGAQTHNNWKEDSSNIYFRENWDIILNAQAHSHLHSSYNIPLKVLEITGKALWLMGIIVKGFFIVVTDPNTECTTYDDEDGYPQLDCHPKQNGNNS